MEAHLERLRQKEKLVVRERRIFIAKQAAVKKIQ